MTASITLHVYFNPLFKNQSLEKGENNRRELSKILSCKSAKIPYKSRVFGVWLSNNEYKFQDRLVVTASIFLHITATHRAAVICREYLHGSEKFIFQNPLRIPHEVIGELAHQ